MSHSTLSPLPVVGLDVGDRVTHLCALDADRQVTERCRFTTSRGHLHRHFADRSPVRVVLEAGSQSPWMAAELQQLGHTVHVADPRRIALISRSHRKTDRRDAETLARMELGMPELLGEVHHRTLDQQAQVALLRARDLLVRTRTQCIQHVRGTLKAFGIRMGSCDATCFHRRVLEVIPLYLEPALQGVLDQLGHLTKLIQDYDRRLEELAQEEVPAAVHLRQVHGVGPITSLAFVLTIADPRRFQKSREVGSWVGLAPRVQASGDKDPQLPISKTGDRYLRKLLVQAAHYILGPFGRDCDLRRFGLRLVARGGKGAKNRAVVAVARKLAVLLHRLWITGEAYEPLHHAERERPNLAAV